MKDPVRWLRALVLPLSLATFAACQPADQAETEAGEMDLDTILMEEVPVDTTAEAVWAHLQQADYADAWQFWPDREPFYQGTEPHGALLSTYLNGTAVDGLREMRAQDEVDDLPFGSIIVKENYRPDSTLAAITVMYKAEGYNPDHHDWWWMKRLADGTVEASGRVEACISCHQEAADTHDYLMTALAEAVRDSS